jgi:hypothetical protein
MLRHLIKFQKPTLWHIEAKFGLGFVTIWYPNYLRLISRRTLWVHSTFLWHRHICTALQTLRESWSGQSYSDSVDGEIGAVTNRVSPGIAERGRTVHLLMFAALNVDAMVRSSAPLWFISLSIWFIYVIDAKPVDTCFYTRTTSGIFNLAKFAFFILRK